MHRFCTIKSTQHSLDNPNIVDLLNRSALLNQSRSIPSNNSRDMNQQSNQHINIQHNRIPLQQQQMQFNSSPPRIQNFPPQQSTQYRIQNTPPQGIPHTPNHLIQGTPQYMNQTRYAATPTPIRNPQSQIQRLEDVWRILDFQQQYIRNLPFSEFENRLNHLMKDPLFVKALFETYQSQ